MSVDYKNTLNLPNTDFPMKANLSQREPEILSKWDTINLYEKIQVKNKGKKSFILADGPPFANGAIHIGHAVNKILKDFIIKSKILSGYDAPYAPGWDCHGLPIELNVEKQVGKPGVKIDAKAFRNKCREYVLKQIDLQRDAFIRLGVLGDWFKPYLTMAPKYEADIVRSLAKIIENGHLHKGYKPVHWCIDCSSALAEAEVEYQEKTSPSIDVAFPLLGERIENLFVKLSYEEARSVSIVIWTTTPWTLPANEAIALNPDFTYVILSLKEHPTYYLIAKELVDSFTKRLSVEEYKIIDECKGEELEGLLAQHPFYEKKVPIILGEHVTLETGTGCVHTAPAHGQEDYLISKKYHLPLENPVASDGCYTPSTPLFAGLHVSKANGPIIELLKEKNHLVHESKIQHSYPHCWRHKTPLIFRATQQWFISMDQAGLREETLKAIQKVQWIPNWGQNRIEKMIADRPDWCVSRQRTWGVPMAMITHKETGEPHPDTPALMEMVAKKMESDGLDAWYDMPLDALLKEGVHEYEKITDTLDVWFDSGVSHYSVLEKRSELSFPANLYLEGSDQHRGWFQSSLLTSMAMNNNAPYAQVLTHGFTVDAHGRKMSKSLGNVIAPDKVVSTLGADILRLWVATTDYRSEIVVSDEILKRTSDIYRRIRNTARFLLANLNGFEPTEQLVPFDQMLALDCYIVEKAQRIQNEIIKDFDEYQFHLVYQKIHHYCAIDLGSFYLDIIKDRQYTGRKDGLPRLSAQTALYHIAECLVRWMAPILSFTAEELWQYIPGAREDSVFLSEWYNKLPAKKHTSDKMDEAFWQQILSVRDEVNKVLEEARSQEIIGSGLEAEIDLYCEPTLYTVMTELKDELRFVLITSRATVHLLEPKNISPNAKETAIEGLWLDVNKSEHVKCVRCWHRRADVNQNTQYPEICGRCVENVAGQGEERHYA